jgi:hypothetical protein
MIPDKIIYTDGRDVTVTNSDLKVKNHLYNLNGILRHGLTKLKANRIPGIVLFVLGAVLIRLGMVETFSSEYNFYLGNTLVTSNVFAAWFGVALALAGTLQIVLVRDRYAVSIATAEGEKQVVVSRHREYVAQIVEALNQAYREIGFHFPFSIPDKPREEIYERKV